MEYCEGGSLDTIIKRMKRIGAVGGEKVFGKVTDGVRHSTYSWLELCSHPILQIMQGLAYLHSRKAIYGNIKPSNVLLTQEGVVKLSEFGLSGELVDSIPWTLTGSRIYTAVRHFGFFESDSVQQC